MVSLYNLVSSLILKFSLVYQAKFLPQKGEIQIQVVSGQSRCSKSKKKCIL